MWAFALAAFLMAGPLKETILRGSPVDVTLLTGLATAAIVAGNQSIRHGWIIPKAVVPVSAFLLAMAVPFLWSNPSTAYGAEKVVLLWPYAAIAMTAPALAVRERRDLNALLYAALLVGTSVGVALLVGFVSEETIRAGHIGLARAAGMGAVVAMWALLYRRFRQKWAQVSVGAAALISTSAIVVTGARGPLLAAAAAIVTMVLFTRRAERRRASVAGVVVIGALLVGSIFVGLDQAPDRAVARLVSLTSGEDTTAAKRVELYEETSEHILSSPAGVAWGEFPDHIDVTGYLGEQLVYPHNVVLEVFVEGGWLVGFAFLALLFVVLKGLIFKARTGDAFAAGVLGLTVFTLANASVSGDLGANRPLLALLATGLALVMQRAHGAAPDHLLGALEHHRGHVHRVVSLAAHDDPT